MASDKRAAQRRTSRATAKAAPKKRETAAQRKKREAEEAEAAAAAEQEAQEAQLAESQQEGQLNAVIVHRIFTEQGFQTVVQTSGDVRITEVREVLRAALRQVKEQLGDD